MIPRMILALIRARRTDNYSLPILDINNSNWQTYEEVAMANEENSLQKKLGKKINALITDVLEEESKDEKLIRLYRSKEASVYKHIKSYIITVSLFFVFFFTIAKEVTPSIIIAVFWGMGLARHVINFKGWVRENSFEIRTAAKKLNIPVKMEYGLQFKELFSQTESFHANHSYSDFLGKNDDMPAEGKNHKKNDLNRQKLNEYRNMENPILIRCENAAQQTRDAVSKVGGEFELEANGAIDAGLSKIKELVVQHNMILNVLVETSPTHVLEEKRRIQNKLLEISDDEAKKIYNSQLELLQKRLEKIKTLQGIQERIIAYIESYLAALGNVRVDAIRIKALDLSTPISIQEMLLPVKQLEQQVDDMKLAFQEVASIVAQN